MPKLHSGQGLTRSLDGGRSIQATSNQPLLACIRYVPGFEFSIEFKRRYRLGLRRSSWLVRSSQPLPSRKRKQGGTQVSPALLLFRVRPARLF